MALRKDDRRDRERVITAQRVLRGDTVREKRVGVEERVKIETVVRFVPSNLGRRSQGIGIH